MQTLELKETKIKVGDTPLTYDDLIRTCLDSAPTDRNGNPAGFTYQELKTRMRVEKALDEADGTLKLESADANNLKAIVAQMRWAFRHADLLTFCDDVAAMKEKDDV